MRREAAAKLNAWNVEQTGKPKADRKGQVRAFRRKAS